MTCTTTLMHRTEIVWNYTRCTNSRSRAMRPMPIRPMRASPIGRSCRRGGASGEWRRARPWLDTLKNVSFCIDFTVLNEYPAAEEYYILLQNGDYLFRARHESFRVSSRLIFITPNAFFSSSPSKNISVVGSRRSTATRIRHTRQRHHQRNELATTPTAAACRGIHIRDRIRHQGRGEYDLGGINDVLSAKCRRH